MKRPELLTGGTNRRAVRAHDLRATFVTLSLAEGRSESWVSDRTVAELFGETGHVERSAGAVGKHQAYLRVSAALPPRLQGTHDAGIERPSAGAVGLVFVEANRAHVEVQVLPSETHGFTPAAPLARQEPGENTVFEGHKAPSTAATAKRT